MNLPFAPALQVSQWFNSDHDLTLSGFRGNVVVLHFFQMLCPGCVSYGVPQAERLHRLGISDRLIVLGVHSVFEHHAAMTPVALKAFLQEYSVTHPIAVDAAVPGDRIPASMRAYALRGTPSLVLIDPEGRIRNHEFGKVDDMALGLRIGRMLGEESD